MAQDEEPTQQTEMAAAAGQDPKQPAGQAAAATADAGGPGAEAQFMHVVEQIMDESFAFPTYAEKVYGCLSNTNPVRKFCINLVDERVYGKKFDMIVMGLILFNSLWMAIFTDPVHDKMLEHDHYKDFERLEVYADKKAWVGIVDMVMLVSFTIEMTVKLIAMGFCWERGSYLRFGWNWLDFTVVITGWLELAAMNIPVAPLRVVRVLRPLRSMQRVRGMRTLVSCIMNAVPKMALVGMVLLFVMLVWGIIGVQLFAGSLRHACWSMDADGMPEENTGSICDPFCTYDPETQLLLDEDKPCKSLGADTWQKRSVYGDTGRWAWTCETGQQCLCGEDGGDDPYCQWIDNPNYGINSFDNIISAMVTIFQSISLEGWVDVMYMLQDGSGSFAWIYMTSLVLIGAMIVMNLFIAVLTDNYDTAADDDAAEHEGEPEEVDQEEAVKEALKTLTWESPFRTKCLGIAVSKVFNNTITVCILINTVVMMMIFAPRTPTPEAYSYPVGELIEAYGYLPQSYFWTLWTCNTILTCIFTWESGVKLSGFGVKIFMMDNFNVFDLLVVAISLVEILLDCMGFAGLLDASLPGLSALRALRIFRIMKLVRSVESLRKILAMLGRSVGSVVYLMLLLCLFVFIFSLLGMELFGGFYPRPETQYNYTQELFPDVFRYYDIQVSSFDSAPFCNFDSFGDAFLSIFVVLSGENWNEIYFDQHRATWKYQAPVATIYFLVLFVLGNLLLFNLFIAILIANAENKEDEEEEEEEDINPTDDPAFLEKDVGKKLAIKGDTVTVDGKSRPVKWGKAQHADVAGVILQVEGCIKGAVKVDSSDGGGFENPAVDSGSGAKMAYSFGGYFSREGEETSSTKDDANGTSAAPEESQAVAPKTLDPNDLPDPNDFQIHGDKACMVLGWDNPLRRAMAKLVWNPKFDQFILVCIIISSITLGCDWPGYSAEDSSQYVIIDYLFTVIFTIEMSMKIIVYGFAVSKDTTKDADDELLRPAYLKTAWGLLDFGIVIISWLAIIMSGSGIGFLRTLRALRAFRPLRLISRMEGMKIVVNTLIKSIPAVSTLGAVALLFFIIFGILFVQMFGGKLGYCLDPLFEDEYYGSRVIPGYDTITERNDFQECMALPKYNISRHDTNGRRLGPILDPELDWEIYKPFVEFPQWVNPHFGNFDNMGFAILLLFEVAALEGWPDVMFMAMGSDSARQYIVPWKWHSGEDPNRVNWEGSWKETEGLYGQIHWVNRYMAAGFFVIWIVIGCFVVMNMVIGVVLDSFNKIKEENDGLAFMTEAQGDWVKAQKQVIVMRPLVEPIKPKGDWRLYFYDIVTAQWFEILIMGVIILNMFFMCIYVWNPNRGSTDMQDMYQVLRVSNIIFFCLYVIEMLVKWVGLGIKGYFKDTWNVFDFFLVVCSVADLALDASPTSGASPLPPTLLRVLRLFRVVRILRVLKTAKSLRTIIMTVAISIPALGNISLLMMICLYIYAAFAHNLFWSVYYTPLAFESNYGGGRIWDGDYYYTNGNSHDGDYINRHANFRNMWSSLLTLTRCATGESFNGIMHDLMGPNWSDNRLRCCPTCGPIVDDVALDSCAGHQTDSFWALFIFISFQFLMGYIIVNGLFVGVILDNFTSVGSEKIGKVTLEQLEEFREVWLRYDPQGTFVVASHNLLAILQQLNGPLGLADKGLKRADMLKFLGELNIPDHGGNIQFMETLTALTHKECGVDLPVNPTTKSLQHKVHKMQTHGVKKGEEKPQHSALTNYLVSLLQSRWRGYTMRKKYTDAEVAGGAVEPAPVQGMLESGDAKPAELQAPARDLGKVRANQVAPA